MVIVIILFFLFINRDYRILRGLQDFLSIPAVTLYYKITLRIAPDLYNKPMN